jgi:hypothetical protein
VIAQAGRAEAQADLPVGLRFPALWGIDIPPDGTKIAFSVGDPIHAEVWAIDNVLMAAPR